MIVVEIRRDKMIKHEQQSRQMTKETKQRKRCSHEGCTNFAKKGGVCVTHGAMVKTMQS
jgi:hypothetical protein